MMNPKLLDFLIQRGGPVSGVCIVGAAVVKVYVGFRHHSTDDVLDGLFWLFIALSIAAVFFRSKRNAEIVTGIAAEAKIQDPDLQASSSVPEVQARIEKIRRESR